MGFKGQSSIVREFITKIRKEEAQKATIRFETEPARRAQVDWIEFGRQYVNGRIQKLYAFVMVMGFSRMPFVSFTTSMNSATLLNCHIKAFRFFGGIPEEILYDNRNLNLTQLNEDALAWIKSIAENKLSQFNQSRNERFNLEKQYLKKIPSSDFDVRDSIPLIVNRESCITYRTNKYSVPPVFIGKTITGRPFLDVEKLELFDADGVSIRIIDCAPAGSRKSFISVEDQEAILKAWEKGLKHDAFKRQAKKALKFSNPDYVAIRNPVFYEQFLAGGL